MSEKTLFNEIVKSGSLRTLHIDFIDDYDDLDIKFDTGISNDMEISYLSYIDGKQNKSSEIQNIKNEENADYIKIFIKNIGTEDISMSFCVSWIYVDKKVCLPKFNYTNKINVSKASAFAKDLEKNLNLFLNANDGVCVTYFRTEPTESDVVMQEYIKEKYVEKKSLNVLFPDNELPNLDELDITEWGAEFSLFEGDIDFNYFESIFGCGIKPRDNDYIYVKEINQMFTVESSILKRGIGGTPTHWVLKFGTYVDNESVEDNEDDGARELINSHEKEFGGELEDEYKDIIDIEQNIPSQIYRDINRETVNEDIVFSATGYVMSAGVKDSVAVKYVNAVTEINYSLLFNTINYSDTSIIKIGDGSITIENGNIFIFGVDTEIQIEREKPIMINIGLSDICTSIQQLEVTENGSIKEISYDETDPINDIKTGSVELLFGDYEIGSIRIFNKIVPRDVTSKIMSKKHVDKPSLTYIIDDCEEINNNPRATESSWKVD